MRGVAIFAAYTVRECRRRRVFVVVPIVSVLFLILYALALNLASSERFGLGSTVPLDVRTLVGASLLGLSMFGSLFLGAVVAVFLTAAAVRGDAEQGLLQPLLVRPVERFSFVLGRLAGALAVSGTYVLLLYLVCMAVTAATIGFVPPAPLEPGLLLACGVAVVAVISLLGSTLLTTVANGIGVLALYGAGLLAGLLGELGEGLRSVGLTRLGRAVSWALPFEALYQDALASLTEGASGLTSIVVRLGPFGGAHHGGATLLVYTLCYCLALTGLAAFNLARRDL